MRPYIGSVMVPVVNELIDQFASRGEADLMNEFCEPLSVRVLKQVLGLTSLDDDVLRRWFADLAVGAANFEADPAKQAVADAASAEVDETVQGLLDKLGTEPDDSILSRMLQSEVDGERLSSGEIQSNLKVMIVGGMQEPGDALGIGVWALLSHPGPGRAGESGSPAHQASGGGVASAGTPPSGPQPGRSPGRPRWPGPGWNRARWSPPWWPRPTGTSAMERPCAARHSPQGGRPPRLRDGSHHCVGAWLARAETRTAFQAAVGAAARLRLDAERPIDLHGWEFRRPLHLHVRWDA